MLRVLFRGARFPVALCLAPVILGAWAACKLKDALSGR